MKYAYASRTGNVEQIIRALHLEALKIEEGSEQLREPFVLFTYCDRGNIPVKVRQFVRSNKPYIRGVVCSGSIGFGDNFCKAGILISQACGVPLLYRVNKAGDETDWEYIQDCLDYLSSSLEHQQLC